MVAAAEGRVLGPHVHLQVLEEVHVLVRGEGYQDAHRAGDSGVHQRLAATRDQRRFLHGGGVGSVRWGEGVWDRNPSNQVKRAH